MKYIVNKHADEHGRHEVHCESYCTHLPEPENRIELGNYFTCNEAIRAAYLKFGNEYNFDGCYYCSRNCHKG